MATTTTTPLEVLWIPLAQIHESPQNPRKHFDPDKLAELAASIREKGVIEPAIVRAKGKGYELVAGARRFRASMLAGVEALPAIVRDLDDAHALEFAVIENQQREDVSPIEEALGYDALRQMDPTRYTVAEIAAKVGKTESYVYRRLKLLTLESKYRDAMAEGRLPIAHGEALCRLAPAERRRAHQEYLIWNDPFEGAETADAVAPLVKLQEFIRARTHFDPTTTDTRHFQPTLAEELDAIAEETGQAAEQVAAELVELSTDSMVRMRLGAGPNTPVPLPPSKWHEIKGAKDRCEFVRRGVVTHGAEARIIEVCTAKTKCTKHFPPSKKTTVATPGAATRENAAKAKQRAEAKAAAATAATLAEAKYWNGLVPRLREALVDFAAKQKLTAELFIATHRQPDPFYNVKGFGVKVTTANLGQAAVLMCIELEAATEDPKHYSFTDWGSAKRKRGEFLQSVKPFKFNVGAIEQKYKADLKAAAQADATASTKKARTPKKGAA